MKSSIFTYLALSAVSVYTNMALAEEPQLDHLSYSAASTLFSNNSRELLLAKRMLESAQAGAVIAAQKPNPVLSIGVSNFNLNRNQGNTNPNGGNGFVDKTLNSSVQINQLLERGNKRELRMAAAEDAIKAAVEDYRKKH